MRHVDPYMLKAPLWHEKQQAAADLIGPIGVGENGGSPPATTRGDGSQKRAGLGRK